MGVLEKQLVEELIKTSTKTKEAIGNMIVLSLGGDPTKKANGLPPRRGNADGGIDGRVPIEWVVEMVKMRPGSREPLNISEIKEDTTAAISVKIEDNKFTRNEFGAFLNDMQRENIFNGIIVTARGLCNDASCEIERINSEKKFHLEHIEVSEILEGKLDFELNFKKKPSEAINDYLEKNI